MISILKTIKKIMMEMIPKTKKTMIRTRMTSTIITKIAILMEITTKIMMKKMMKMKVRATMIKRRIMMKRKI